MKFKIKVHPKEISEFIQAYYFQKVFPRHILFLLIVILVTFNQFYRALQIIPDLPSKLTIVIISYSFLLLSFFFIMWKSKKNIIAKVLTNEFMASTLSTGLEIDTESQAQFSNWEEFKEAEIIKNYFYITTYTSKIYLIPVRCLLSNTEANEFMDQVKFGIFKESWRNDYRKVRNLYRWGLLGLLPNIGVIVGIVLIAKGIKYKAQKLILVGLADIILTFIIWKILFLYVFNK